MKDKRIWIGIVILLISIIIIIGTINSNKKENNNVKNNENEIVENNDQLELKVQPDKKVDITGITENIKKNVDKLKNKINK